MMRVRSLRARVLLWLSVILLAFFAATILALEWSLSASLARARAEVLEAQLIALMSAAEADEDDRVLSVPVLPDRRMATPESGLYGEIRAIDGALLWGSPSAIGLSAAAVEPAPPGVRRQRQVGEQRDAARMERSVTVAWEFDDGLTEQFVFAVSQSLAPYHAQQRGFRMGLISWFAGLTLATLVLLSLALRAALRPLVAIEREIRDIETGRREQLSTQQPAELAGVSRNLNALLLRERGRQQRYRDSLANLAHSLKTPLAAMQTVLAGLEQGDVRRVLNEGIARMDRIVAYQLQRANALRDRAGGMRRVVAAPVLTDLVESLAKVYPDRHMDVHSTIDETASFFGDEGDLQEILGNLLDNAWKFGRSRIDITVSEGALAGGGRTLHISVEDDGPGLPDDMVEAVTARGMRLDESMPGQGIGLAVVRDVVESYQGRLSIGRSSLGGASLTVTLPAAR